MSTIKASFEGVLLVNDGPHEGLALAAGDVVPDGVELDPQFLDDPEGGDHADLVDHADQSDQADGADQAEGGEDGDQAEGGEDGDQAEGGEDGDQTEGEAPEAATTKPATARSRTVKGK